MRIVVLAVGRLRPPCADDVGHYQKLLAGHARLELTQLRQEEQVSRRTPHQLARVMLLEHLYRGHKILALEPCHC